MRYRQQLFELHIATLRAAIAAIAMTNDYIWTSRQMVRVEKFRL